VYGVDNQTCMNVIRAMALLCPVYFQPIKNVYKLLCKFAIFRLSPYQNL
jgi:hypothetical protein